jgi:hypothetical protein
MTFTDLLYVPLLFFSRKCWGVLTATKNMSLTNLTPNIDDTQTSLVKISLNILSGLPMFIPNNSK